MLAFLVEQGDSQSVVHRMFINSNSYTVVEKISFKVDHIILFLPILCDPMRLIMKGKRKANTTKWLMKGQFEMEARLMLQKRSRDASNHFLDAEATFGVESEPVGLLAGRLR